MKYRTACTVHVCDGCGTSVIQVDHEALPVGYYLDITSVNHEDVQTGRLFVCGSRCILAAFRQIRRKWDRTPH